MANGDSKAGYRIWAIDNMVYGPIELPTVKEWIQEQRILADTWIFIENSGTWHKAVELPELKTLFQAESVSDAPAPAAVHAPSAPGIRPGMLRRVKILADMNDEQLELFARFTEVQNVSQWTEIVRQGSSSDAMFLVLEGEVRVRLMIDGRETTLATLSTGDFFGEIGLFDQGPRAADVVANQDTLLLRLSAGAFEQLADEEPRIATLYLVSICRSLAARFRADDKRIREGIVFARTAFRAL
jgi:hypothetical protein